MTMKSIPFEDRSSETPEQAVMRQLRAAAGLVTQAAAGLCQGHTALTLQLLAAALGQAAAETGASLDDVFTIVRHERKIAERNLAEQALWSRKADA